MAIYQPLPEKALKKHREELLELHKRCIKNYLIQRDVKLKGRNKFFKLYDYYLNEKNVLEYWNLPINIFVQGLIQNNPSICFKPLKSSKHVRKNSKESIRRKK